MEKWKVIKGYEGIYEVSNHGKIKSLARKIKHSDGNSRNVKERILNPANDKDGYLFLTLSKNGTKKQCRVHRIVAEAFIENPDKKPQINHINEVKNDNRASNLEWATSKENINHGTGIEKRAKKGRKPVIGRNLKTGEEKIYPSILATEKDGFISRTISSVCKGIEGRTQHKGYSWSYLD